MATLQTSKVAASVQPRSNLGLCAQYATYTVTAALALNDVIQMVKVPAGATILGVKISFTDLDTGGSPTLVLQVGDGGDVDRYAEVTAPAGDVQALEYHAGHLYQYESADTIDILVSTGPQTGATSGTITMVALYTMAQ